MGFLMTYHEIRFTGNRTGDAPLTWGQQCIWDEAKWFAPHHEHFNLKAVIEVPEGVGLPGVLGALRDFIEDRESLRTTYPTDSQGVPYQHVPMGGSLSVVEESFPAEEARSAARALAERLQGTPFSLDEFPVRAGIIASGSSPRFLILVIFHLAADIWDMRNVVSEMKQLLASPDGARGTVTARDHPFDEAQRAQEPRGRAVSERALKHWRAQLAHAPVDMLAGRAATPESSRFQEIYIGSEALSIAIHALARRLRVTPTVVFLAVASIAMGDLGGQSRAFFLLGCHNRFTARDRMATGTVSQDSPVTVDLSGGDFRKVVQRVWSAGLSAYASAKWDPTAVAAAVEEAERQRGERVDLSCNVNVDLEAGAGAAEPESPAGAEFVQELRHRTRIVKELGTSQDRTGRRFFLRASTYSKEIIVSLRADTTVLSSSDIVKFLEDMEELAVREYEAGRAAPAADG
ncbi:condensation domain-containing protein [Streptomyces sp. NPDC090108]|uniref:condensation domain-containing protein n=1 Tax=Streptomyces sp. NPDC090108 TaxID=3365947 RepID=UPI0038113DA3